MIWPLIDGIGLITRQPMVSRTALGLMLTAMITSLVATATGQMEFDQAVAAGFEAELLNQHASYGSMVPWVLMAVSAVRLWLPGQIGGIGPWLGVLFGMVSWWLIVHVGHTGGVLVYEWGVGIAAPTSHNLGPS
ncbi:MAG: hypothetical protein KTR25_19765 [Myxococcales bacterium]|nr:hypothetical protein [Myxococcales bacterium]